MNPDWRNPAAWVRRHCNSLSIIVSAMLLIFCGASLLLIVAADHPFSFLDEHVHFDTVLKIHDGRLSYRGALYEPAVVQEWACGVGHEAGGLAHGCGDPRLGVRDVTSGEFTTGYIHYPTYFLAAEGFRSVVEAASGPRHDVTVYRAFSALLMWLGLAASGVFAYLLGVRRAGLIASVSVPAAATSILVMGTMVTPNSTALLAGALVAGTGLLWIKRGRGFGWLALAAAFASTTAVINSLPVGGLILLIAVVAIARRRGWSVPGTWAPRLWHAIALAVVVLAPIVVWGRYIASTATVSNADVYGPYQLQGLDTLLVGAFQEMFSLHSPWTEWALGMPPGPGAVARSFRAIAAGIPLWVTVVVIGAVVFLVVGTSFVRGRQVRAVDHFGPAAGVRSGSGRMLDPARILCATTLATLVMYPPALRVANALNFGIDFGIVTRYSMAFAPLFVLLVLVMVRQRAFVATLATLGSIGVVTTAGIWV